MTPRIVRCSIQAYQKLLNGYPPGFRLRFAGEMRQVFCLLCEDEYRRAGAAGLPGFWLRILWDWSRTAAGQWRLHFRMQRRMKMFSGLDQQLGDMIWSISTGLRAAYDLRQVFEALAIEAPEPAATACKLLLAELDQGADMQTALAHWKQALPSPALARLVEVLNEHHTHGGHLPDLLDPLEEALSDEYGSDPAFYAAMRREAEQLGAPVPQRAAQHNL